MNVAFLPVYANPYQRLLRDSLAPHGVTVTLVESLPSDHWLRDQRRNIDLLHYHWLYGLYMSRLSTPRQVIRFTRHVRLARQLGYKMVWTAHNVVPHRRALRPLHIAMRRTIVSRVDAVITHCEAGRQAIVQRFAPCCPVHVVPIGNYENLNSPARSRAIARRELDLPEDSFIYLAWGNIAAYKGLERLTAAFNLAAGETDVLVIAGRDRDARVVRRLQHAAAHDRRIRLTIGYVPDDEVGAYMRAADVLVAPFEDILTSSSVMVALAHGRPIVVPSLGCMPELVSSGAGLLFEARNTDALASALRKAKTVDLSAMGAAARTTSAAMRWEEVGRRTAAIYASCLSN